jgi:leucyl/phenylalanyl-tRNA---protein transferase
MREPHLPWLNPGDAFPDTVWGDGDPIPGLVAAGGALDVDSLQRAYAQGIFPWFNDDQPILWWSPSPRMVLQVAAFRLHRSLRKHLQHFSVNPDCAIRIDTAFDAVISRCARIPRKGQPGTWIVPAMAQAYGELHRRGLVHSVEVWVDGKLAAGLYCVALGRAVFGESMFTDHTDGSKVALAALIALCRAQGVVLVDCQQQTGHMASLGAAPISRAAFHSHLAHATGQAPLQWEFSPLYWQHILPSAPHD